MQFLNYLRGRTGKWRRYTPMFGEPAMRRWINGRWQYRKLTDEEVADLDEARVW